MALVDQAPAVHIRAILYRIACGIGLVADVDEPPGDVGAATSGVGKTVAILRDRKSWSETLVRH